MKVSNKIDEVTGRMRRNGCKKIIRGRRNNASEKLERGRLNWRQANLRNEDKHEFCALCTLYQTYEC